MCHDEERTRIVTQSRLQTLDGRQVEVVRRLVEQEHIGCGREGGPDLPAFPLAGTIVREPVSGGWFPARSDRRVDLPAPFAPTRPVQPGPRSKEASSMTGTADEYEYETCETWMADMATPLVGRVDDPEVARSSVDVVHGLLVEDLPSISPRAGSGGHARRAAPEDRPPRQNESRPTRRGTSPDHRRGRHHR